MENEVLRILKKINQIVSEKRNIIHQPSHSFKIIVHASFFRALDYTLAIFRKKKPPIESMFLKSGLRAICEDLIYVVAISKWPLEDANKYIDKLLLYECNKNIKSQHEFFKKEKPNSLYLKPSDFLPSIKVNIDDLVNFWKKNGYSNCEGSFPSVFRIAKQNGLEHMYNFLYHATSKSVHHSAHYLYRMGFGNEKTQKDEFHFQVGNFKKYFFAFCQFYGIYLLCLYYKHLGVKIGIKECLSKEISLLLQMQEDMRWPEIVTFEEMNVKPPSSFDSRP